MPRKRITNRKNLKKHTSEKDLLSNFEKIQFLQSEYDWQKKRRNDFVDKAKMFLCWNAAAFTFSIAFTDVERIVNLFKQCNVHFIHTSAVVLSIILIISIVVLAVSSYGYFSCLKVNEIKCFKTEEYIDGKFDFNNIIKDYREIIIDYDESIKRDADIIDFNIKLMVIGITSILVIEFLLKILVSI